MSTLAKSGSTAVSKRRASLAGLSWSVERMPERNSAFLNAMTCSLIACATAVLLKKE